MKAWHFVGNTLRDGSPVPPDGVTLFHRGKVVPCESGLHASLHPFDALRFAPGATLCLVEVHGTIIEHGYPVDKLVCSERTIVARMDAEPLLREFARHQALSVAHLWDAPDAVLEYLLCGGNDAALDAARDAASDAAAAAAEYAAAAAAKYAALDAARATARAAARATARAAARAAAWDHARAAREAARAAAMASAKDDFHNLVVSAFKDWL